MQPRTKQAEKTRPMEPVGLGAWVGHGEVVAAVGMPENCASRWLGQQQGASSRCGAQQSALDMLDTEVVLAGAVRKCVGVKPLKRVTQIDEPVDPGAMELWCTQRCGPLFNRWGPRDPPHCDQAL